MARRGAARSYKQWACWFCQQKPGEDATEAREFIHREYPKLPLSETVLFDAGVIVIPRCPACKRVHHRENLWLCAGFVCGPLLGVLLMLVTLYLAARFGLGDSGAVAAVLLGLGVGCLLPYRAHRRYTSWRVPGVRPDKDAKEYPLVKQMLAAGWRLGEHPSD